jgi:hypothetical protein
MAKKYTSKRVGYGNPDLNPSQNSNHAWNQVSASQALMAARGFKPFDFLVKRCDSLSELVVNIDNNAEIALESRQRLVNQAQLILGGNVISKKAAQGKKDVAWVEAAWAHPEGSERLDPITTFEVGVAVARSQRPYDECEKASRFLKLAGDLPEGLRMLPDENGDHINVPMLGILLKPGLVEVRRVGKDVDGKKAKGVVVGTASIWHALIGFEERDKERFAKPTRAEQVEIEAEKREAWARNKAAKDKEEKARKEQEAVEDLGGCFEDIWGEWEIEQEEIQEAERSEQWKEFVEDNEELRVLWGKCKDISKKAYEENRQVIEALQLVLRPTPPRKADLKKALPSVRHYLQGLSGEHTKARWGELTDWVKDFKSREGLSLGESLAKANSDLPWLLPAWFIAEEGLVTLLYPLKGLRDYSRDEWLGRVALEPKLDDEIKIKLFSLAGEE